jgi:thioredoxin-dependent peroxiredoxin
MAWRLFQLAVYSNKFQPGLIMQVKLDMLLPNFEVQSTRGTISSQDLVGKYLILYFYPKDNTPGCTCEANDFNSLYQDFTAANAEIIGVSRDTIKSHANFKTKKKLQFDLIADTNSKLCDLFAVINSKSIFGKTALGLVRSTFLFGPDGKLIREWRKVAVKDHAKMVLATILAHQASN